MNSMSIRCPFLLTFWSGSSAVSIYTPVVGRPYRVLAGMVAAECSRPFLTLAALISLIKGAPKADESREETKLELSCFPAQQ